MRILVLLLPTFLSGCIRDLKSEDGGSERTANLPRQSVGDNPHQVVQYVGVDPTTQNGDTLSEEESRAIENIKKIPQECVKVFTGLLRQIGQGLRYETSADAKAFAQSYVSQETAKIKDISLTHHRTAKEARIACFALKQELMKVFRLIDEVGSESTATLPKQSVGIHPPPQNGDALSEEESRAIEDIKRIPGKCVTVFTNLERRIGQRQQFKTSGAAKAFAQRYVSSKLGKIKEISLTHPLAEKEARRASVALELELKKILELIDGAEETTG